MRSILVLVTIVFLATGCSSPSLNSSNINTNNVTNAQLDTSYNSYRNSQFGFEMKYPTNYSYIISKTDSDLLYVWFGRKPLSEEGPVEYSVSVKNSSVADEFKTISNEKSFRNITKENITINNQVFTLVQWQRPSLPGAIDFIESEAALVEKNNLLYRIDIIQSSRDVLSNFILL